MLNNEEIISVDNLIMRLHRPDGSAPYRILLMLHGWTGDENSMWVFAPRLLKDAMMVAPRGLYKTEGGGYSWHPRISKPWPWVSDFQPAVKKLFATITNKYIPDGDFSELHIVGFSQGAALAYTMAIMFPERIASLAGLSGFLPDGASAWLGKERLKGMPIFIAHGCLDDRVPIVRARDSVALLQKSGSDITYCEDNVGHKLSVKCFRGLEAFYERVNS